MKRAIYLTITAVLLCCACTNKAEEVIYASRVNLSKDNMSIAVGSSGALTATLYPEGVSKPSVTWSSMDEGIATVSDNGLVSAVSPGVTYIVAVSGDGMAKSSCMVTVKLTDGYFISILDEDGAAVDRIWRYPGAMVPVAAECSDDSEHSLTWNTGDPSAVFADGGMLTFRYRESADPAYLCYAATSLTAAAEDGTSASVPVVSNLLSEFELAGMTVRAGTEAGFNPQTTGSIVLYYSDGRDKVPVPAGAYELTSSSSTVISVEREGDSYVLVSSGSGSTRLRVRFPGCEPLSLADLTVARNVAASCTAATSSTLTYTWTRGDGVNDDIAHSWMLDLYSDAACTAKVHSFEVSAGHDCWNAKQPCFSFAGLSPDTSYWFVVTDLTDDEHIKSMPVEGKTEPFNIVMVSDTPAAAGDILLAEDFGQLCWGGDLPAGAAGYTVPDYNVPTFMDDNASNFVKGATTTSERIFANHIMAITADGFRLADWAQGAGNNLYVHTGYIKMGTSSAITHLVTPALDNIPDGASATIEVTVCACKWSGSIPNPIVAVQTGSIKPFKNASGQKNSNLDLSGNTETVSLGSYTAGWANSTVTLQGVKKGNRIAFGPAAGVSGGNGRLMISGLTIKLISINQ